MLFIIFIIYIATNIIYYETVFLLYYDSYFVDKINKNNEIDSLLLHRAALFRYIVLLCTHYHRFLRIVKINSISFIIILFVKLSSYNYIDHVIYMGPSIKSAGFQLPLEKLFWHHSFERVSSVPALQYLFFGGPSLGTYLLSERLFIDFRYSNLSKLFRGFCKIRKSRIDVLFDIEIHFFTFHFLFE